MNALNWNLADGRNVRIEETYYTIGMEYPLGAEPCEVLSECVAVVTSEHGKDIGYTSHDTLESALQKVRVWFGIEC